MPPPPMPPLHTHGRPHVAGCLECQSLMQRRAYRLLRRAVLALECIAQLADPGRRAKPLSAPGSRPG